MREMKDSGIEWIHDIPDNWNVMPNKYLMHKTKTICPVYNGEDILSLTVNGVVVRDLDAGGKMPTSFDGYQKVEAGNLLMCLFDIDVTPRCIGLINQDGLTSPAYSQFELENIADAAYYDYYYLMLDYDKTLLHLAKNLRHSLTEEQLGTVPTVVPPLEEQHAIADYLDRKCAEIDAIAADIETQIETLEQYKRSVITEAVTKGLDPDAEMKDSGVEYINLFPADWELIKLKYILKERNERSKSGEETLLSVSQTKGVIPAVFLGKQIMQAESLVGYKKVYKGDLVFNKLNPGLARFGCSKYDGITSPDFSVYIVDKNCSAKFLQYLLRTDKYVTQFKGTGAGVGDGFSRLYSSQLYQFYIALPRKNEIDEIVAYLNQKCAEINKIIDEKHTQIETLAEYKKSLIYEYVTGKKEVPSA